MAGMKERAMTDLKIGKLPDRTPVKITFSAWPDLNQALSEYAIFYEQTYGEAETVAELVPFMLDSFLKSDRAFAQVRKRSSADDASERSARHPHRRPNQHGGIAMSVIGNFTLAKDGGWTGNIRTLAIDAKLRLVPNDNREHENAPAFRAMIGWSRIDDA